MLNCREERPSHPRKDLAAQVAIKKSPRHSEKLSVRIKIGASFRTRPATSRTGTHAPCPTRPRPRHRRCCSSIAFSSCGQKQNRVTFLSPDWRIQVKREEGSSFAPFVTPEERSAAEGEPAPLGLSHRYGVHAHDCRRSISSISYRGPMFVQHGYSLVPRSTSRSADEKIGGKTGNACADGIYARLLRCLVLCHVLCYIASRCLGSLGRRSRRYTLFSAAANHPG